MIKSPLASLGLTHFPWRDFQTERQYLIKQNRSLPKISCKIVIRSTKTLIFLKVAKIVDWCYWSAIVTGNSIIINEISTGITICIGKKCSCF